MVALTPKSVQSKFSIKSASDLLNANTISRVLKHRSREHKNHPSGPRWSMSSLSSNANCDSGIHNTKDCRNKPQNFGLLTLLRKCYSFKVLHDPYVSNFNRAFIHISPIYNKANLVERSPWLFKREKALKRQVIIYPPVTNRYQFGRIHTIKMNFDRNTMNIPLSPDTKSLSRNKGKEYNSSQRV